jgi:hypothetical protein
MPQSKYIRITLDGQALDLSDTDVQISINYQQEDADDFTKKKSSEAFSIIVPATVNNDQLSNTLHNPSIEDMTSGQAFRGYRNGTIEANGDELLVGKAFLKSGRHTDRPTSYEYDFYGNNADWIIPLTETTLHDLLKHISFYFTKDVIVNSWNFNGLVEVLPYVFAPVRYRPTVDFYDETVVDDNYKDINMTPLYMKPSVSVYWIIYWAFKSIGYRVKSTFMDSEYFRRQIMPWGWGNFLSAEGNRQDNIKFLAKSTERVNTTPDASVYADVKASNESTDGAYDTNDVYFYDPFGGEMRWVYPIEFSYGKITATFNLQVDWEVFINTHSELEMYVEWSVGGIIRDTHGIILQSTGASAFSKRDVFDDYFSWEVLPGDFVSAKIHVRKAGDFFADASLEVIQFTLNDIRIPLGGTIDFQNYNDFKNHKFLDFLGGIFDCFNILPGTDPINKVVILEPAHPYSVTNDPTNKVTGYFNEDYLDWNAKQDLSKESIIDLYSDYERELTMKFKDDSNDGILKLIQDRNSNTLAAGKYVFPERFKAEKKDIENRFFSPVMHYEVSQWQNISTPAITVMTKLAIPFNPN